MSPFLKTRSSLPMGNATLTTRLVEGDYPNYEKIIPESTEGRTVVSRDQILSATRRVALLSNPKNYSICLEIDTEQVRVYTRTPGLGEAHETVPVASGNGKVRVGGIVLSTTGAGGEDAGKRTAKITANPMNAPAIKR